MTDPTPRCILCQGRLIQATPGQRTHPTCAPEGDIQPPPAHWAATARTATAKTATSRSPLNTATSTSSAAPVLDFARFTAADWQLWHAAYVAGYLEGAHDERAHVEADRVAAATRGAAVVHRLADVPPRDVLLQDLYPGKVGQHRAQAVREHWRNTGLVGGAA